MTRTSNSESEFTVLCGWLRWRLIHSRLMDFPQCPKSSKISSKYECTVVARARGHIVYIYIYLLVFLHVLNLKRNLYHIVWLPMRSGQWIHALYTHTHRRTLIKALSGQISSPAYVWRRMQRFIFFQTLKSYPLIINFFVDLQKILNPLLMQSQKKSCSLRDAV